MIERKVTHHSAASATAAGTVMNCTGLVGALVQVTGTFGATVTFQGTIDGSTWVAIQAENTSSGAVATTATAAGLYFVPFAGIRLFRASMVWTSGTSITVTGLGVGSAPYTLADVILAANAGTIIGDVDEAPVAAASADVHEPNANTAAVVTYAASTGVKHVITGIAWSYAGGIPASGSLKVEDVSGTTVFVMGITEEGAGIITFPKPKKAAAANTAMIVTLAAGGSGVTGKLSCLNHWTES